MEIERKFEVKWLPDLAGARKKEIAQWYLSYSPEKRVRRICERYVVTEKSTGDLVREEKEYPIDHDTARALIASSGRKPVEKTRYVLTEGALCAEIDVFEGELSGLVICEFEFDSLEEAKSASFPSWIGKEITHDPASKNSFLSRKINKEI